MKNKKSQIGTTLTWFVGFLIIFFVVVLFLMATLILSERKRIGSGKDEVGLVFGNTNLDMQGTLMFILSQQVLADEEWITIEDLIFKIYSDNLEKDKKLLENELNKWFSEHNHDFRYYLGVYDPQKSKESKEGTVLHMIFQIIKGYEGEEEPFLIEDNQNLELVRDKRLVGIMFYLEVKE